MSEEVATTAWMRSRAPVWRAWRERFAAADDHARGLTVPAAQRRIDDYRALARDLSVARRLLPQSGATTALESLYAAAHAQIDRAERRTRHGWFRLLRDEVPAVMRSLRGTLFWVALALGLATGAGWWLISTYPELIGLIASNEMIDKVEHGSLWTQDILNVAPSSVVSIRILSNNIVVTLAAFCGGLFCGLGAFYIVTLNGLMLGALMAFTHQHGLDGELLRFVLAHGLVELSVICLGGSAGIALGESLLRPRSGTRIESFERTAKFIAPLLLVGAALLVVCGFIEGYVSPLTQLSLGAHAAIGIGYWLLMWAVLSGRIFQMRRNWRKRA